MAKRVNDNVVSCGDWHLGWGYIQNKIGKLSLDKDVFTWIGHCQGRHGQTGSKYTVKFTLNENWDDWNSEGSCISFIDKGSLPTWSELKKAIDTLLNKQKQLI